MVFFEQYNPWFASYFKVVAVKGLQPLIISTADKKPEEIHQLAVASSTIPFVTGITTKVDGKHYVDGAFRRGFRVDRAANDFTVEGVTLAIDPNGYQQGKVTIHPSQKLSSGLKLGSPTLMKEEAFALLITQGYNDAMDVLKLLD